MKIISRKPHQQHPQNKSLWTEIADKENSQLSGGKCRWARGIGLVCETKSGRTIAL
jgi:hypothetical protein